MFLPAYAASFLPATRHNPSGEILSPQFFFSHTVYLERGLKKAAQLMQHFPLQLLCLILMRYRPSKAREMILEATVS